MIRSFEKVATMQSAFKRLIGLKQSATEQANRLGTKLQRLKKKDHSERHIKNVERLRAFRMNHGV